MVKGKRWFLREDTDVKQFAIAVKLNREFTAERQKEMLKMIMKLKFDKLIITGVKKRRIRKKKLKKEIEDYKTYLSYRVLDMMECREVDVDSEKYDQEKGKELMDIILKLADNVEKERTKAFKGVEIKVKGKQIGKVSKMEPINWENKEIYTLGKIKPEDLPKNGETVTLKVKMVSPDKEED